MDINAALPIFLGLACLAFLGLSIIVLLAAYFLSKPSNNTASPYPEERRRRMVMYYRWHNHLPPFDYPEIGHHYHNSAMNPPSTPKFPSFDPNSTKVCPSGLNRNPGMGPINQPSFPPPPVIRTFNQPSFPKPPTIPMYKPSPPIIPPFSQPGLLRPPGMGPVQPPGQPPFPAGPRFHK